MVEGRSKSSSAAYWITFLIFLTGGVYLMLLGGYTWRGGFDLQLAGLILGGIGLLAFLTWRGVLRRARFPRTGLEPVFGLAWLGLILALVFSPAPQEGFWQAGCLTGYLLLFFILLDGFNAGLDRNAALDAILWVSGAAVALAVVETSQWYSSWWAVGGGLAALPPYQYRFIGILMSSIPLMGLANLLAPLALIGFLKDQSRLPRLLKGAWLIFYFLALPFSSSWAAWLGMLTWAGVLLGFWAMENRPWQWLSRWPMRRRITTGLAGCLVVLILVLGGRWFFNTFAANPSHGTDIMGDSGRSVFWANALAIWRTSQLVGVGPGRFPFAYLAAAPDTLPGFWPFHAHNTYLLPLAVSGLIGFAAFLALLLWGLRWTWGNYHLAPRVEKPWGKAILAGLGSLLVQMVFDEFGVWIPAVVFAIILLAWLATPGEDHPLPLWPKISINWLWAPGLVIAGLAGWSLWAYQPAAGWAGAVLNGNWAQAAGLFDQSARRAPTFALYPAEAGLAWANAWQADGDPVKLEQAVRSFQNALGIEPAYSPWWADLSVLYWQAGDRGAAVSHMQEAVRLSRRVPEYYLNLGWFAEQSGHIQEASQAYRQALHLAPAWAGHPYWQANPLRQEVLDEWQTGQPESAPAGPAYWQRARAEIGAGDLAGAAADLAYSRLLGEPVLPILVSEGQLARAKGDLPQARQSFSQAVELMAWNDYPGGQGLAFFLERFVFNRSGLGGSYVPGYMTLQADVGQFEAAEWLYNEDVRAGNCPQAQKTWERLQKARQGLSLEPVDLQPLCNP